MSYTVVEFPATIRVVVYDHGNEDDDFVRACEHVRSLVSEFSGVRVKGGFATTVSVPYRQGTAKARHDPDPMD